MVALTEKEEERSEMGQEYSRMGGEGCVVQNLDFPFFTNNIENDQIIFHFKFNLLFATNFILFKYLIKFQNIFQTKFVPSFLIKTIHS